MSIRSPDIAIMSLASDQMLLPQVDRIHEPPPFLSVPGRESAVHSYRRASVRAKHRRAVEVARSDGLGAA